MVVFLEVVVWDEVSVELEVQHVVLALDVPGHGKVLDVAASTVHVYCVLTVQKTGYYLPSSSSSLVLDISLLCRPWYSRGLMSRGPV